jgi:hypothetical protein
LDVGNFSYEAKLREAELQVVQHGSRSSFRRRVIDAMRSLVSSTGAFCFLGRGDGRAIGDATRVVGDNRVTITHSSNHCAATEFQQEMERRTGKRILA